MLIVTAKRVNVAIATAICRVMKRWCRVTWRSSARLGFTVDAAASSVQVRLRKNRCIGNASTASSPASTP